MSINPITSTKNIRAEYTKYLKSMFLFKDNKLRTAANKAIDISKTELIKGPYLESTATYEKGATLHEMVARGDLHKGFERLIPEIGEYNLHKHQEKAIYKASVEKKNIIISTGTGSGKTEGFLVPILNYLVEEKEAGSLGPGVRALLLYPMNALANDQLKRLRGILKEYPEITFGRYTGETKQTKSEAIDYFKKINTEPEDKMLPNELLSRDEMRDTPPNILLTNYAMLEYLLLRPDDNAFFDGLYSQSWKYIVLDEAHVYSGSLGSEISYLLARLKDRVVDGEKGKLQFIATSATLGGGETEMVDVIQYATDLFGEDFSADCLITSARVKTRLNGSLIKPDISWYSEFLDLTEQYSGSELVEKINERNIYN
ncbi:MAG TPA: DEAD/DEAH box helicase, partial [Tissierellaceae bacterium]|nr:DEAD/DEAH box helicase [Tissierellaceae bacterium]